MRRTGILLSVSQHNHSIAWLAGDILFRILSVPQPLCGVSLLTQPLLPACEHRYQIALPRLRLRSCYRGVFQYLHCSATSSPTGGWAEGRERRTARRRAWTRQKDDTVEPFVCYRAGVFVTLTVTAFCAWAGEHDHCAVVWLPTVYCTHGAITYSSTCHTVWLRQRRAAIPTAHCAYLRLPWCYTPTLHGLLLRSQRTHRHLADLHQQWIFLGVYAVGRCDLHHACHSTC